MKLKIVFWILLTLSISPQSVIAQSNDIESLGNPITKSCEISGEAGELSSANMAFCSPFESYASEDNEIYTPSLDTQNNQIIENTYYKEINPDLYQNIIKEINSIKELCNGNNSSVCAEINNYDFTVQSPESILNDWIELSLTQAAEHNNYEMSSDELIQTLLKSALEMYQEVKAGLQSSATPDKKSKLDIQLRDHLSDIDSTNQEVNIRENSEIVEQTGEDEINFSNDIQKEQDATNQQKHAFQKNKQLNLIKEKVVQVLQHLDVDDDASLAEAIGSGVASTVVEAVDVLLESVQLFEHGMEFGSDGAAALLGNILQPTGLFSDQAVEQLDNNFEAKLDVITELTNQLIDELPNRLSNLPEGMYTAATESWEVAVKTFQGEPKSVKRFTAALGNLVIGVSAVKGAVKLKSSVNKLRAKWSGKPNKVDSSTIHNRDTHPQHSEENWYIPEESLHKERIKDQDIAQPLPAAEGRPHTRLGRKFSSTTGRPYRQTAHFHGSKDPSQMPGSYQHEIPMYEVHWTDHGRPHDHTNPHGRIYNYDLDQKTWKAGNNREFNPQTGDFGRDLEAPGDQPLSQLPEHADD